MCPTDRAIALFRDFFPSGGIATTTGPQTTTTTTRGRRALVESSRARLVFCSSSTFRSFVRSFVRPSVNERERTRERARTLIPRKSERARALDR